MPLCSKCHQKEATVHFTTIMGDVQETVHFCSDCAPPVGLPSLDPKKLAALSVTGKKCEFCGRDAASGTIDAGGAIYWCSDCGMEYSRILAELCASERPDLVGDPEASTFVAFCSVPELRAWSEQASRKVVKIMRERRQQSGT